MILQADSIAEREPIAIIGMACRLPANIEQPSALWELLSAGGTGITRIPSERWDVDFFFDPDPDKPGKMYSRHGGFLGGIDRFDAAFFNISRREANQLDPQQRLLLETCWEALEAAGIEPLSLGGSRTGVFVGVSTSDYLQLKVRQNNPAFIDPYSGTGNAFSVTAGRVSYTLGLQGPSLAVDTACSSSLVSVHLACRSLRGGESDLVLAAGVNLILQPDTTVSFSKARMLAADGRCKTFDASADGYTRGEGCGVVVLKRLSQARRDRDLILAIVRGSAVNHDGRSNGLTAPNGQAQEAVIRAALADGGVEPGEVDYVEAHGTGTPLGDPIEVRALGRVFGPGRSAERPLWLGSIKTNIGHLEAAAGVAGLMKVVLSLRHRQMPPHLHFERPNPHIEWEKIPVRVVQGLRAWEKEPEGRRIAGVSSFGFGGTNAHVVIEEGDEPGQRKGGVDRPLHVVTLSGRSEEALRQLGERYAKYLGEHGEVELADVAYTANTGRSHFGYRLAVVGKDGAEVRQRLEAAGKGRGAEGVWQGQVESRPRVMFLFSGQGSQYAGMGRQLYETQPVFRRAIEGCEKILKGGLRWPLTEVMWGEQSRWLDETEFTQPAVFALEYGLAQLWRSWGVEPDAVMGHSVGEYVAACVAGVFGLEEGLGLIAQRAALMQGLPQEGEMAAVLAGAETVEEVVRGCGSEVSIAALNGPRQTVISGLKGEMAAVLQGLRGQGIGVERLKVSHGFHSAQMEGMLEEFGRVAGRIRYEAPKIPLVSNLTGEWLEEAPTARYWQRHTREAVQFMKGMGCLEKEGFGAYLEVGAQPVLLGLGQRCGVGEKAAWLGSLRRGRGEWEQMLESAGRLYVHGVELDWRGFDREYERQRIELPTYPFQRQRYWLEEVGRKSIPPTSTPQTREHPLLGWRLNLAIENRLYENELSGSELGYLQEHRVCGTPVMPAAAYIEIALAAGRQMWGEVALTIEQVELTDTLAWKEGETWRLQVLLEGEAEGWVGFQVFARQDGTAGGQTRWQSHARGKLRKHPDLAGGESRPEELAGRLGEPLPAPDYYEQLARQGLEYGKRFQGIEQLWRANGEVWGRVRLPVALRERDVGYLLHPVLLDSCFQLMGAAFPADLEEGGMYLPAGLDRFLQIDSKPLGEAWCHARVRIEGAVGFESVAGDLSIYNPAGSLVAQISGLRLKRVNRKSWLRLFHPQVEDWLYEIEWRPQALPETSAMPVAGRWLIFTDDNEMGEAVAARLRDQGGEPALIACRGNGEGDIPPQEIFKAGPGYRGVVCLAGVDAMAADQSSPNDFEAEQELITRRTLAVIRTVIGGGFGARPRLWIVTRGVFAVGGAGALARLSAAALPGLAKVAGLEHPELDCVCVDLDPDLPGEQLPELIRELAAAPGEQQVVLRNHRRYVARLVKSSLESEARGEIVPGQSFRLEIQRRGVLDDLVLNAIERPGPAPGEVEIEVKAAGLNFRDVLNALGMYPGDPGLLGGECAGTISAVGSEVAKFEVGQDVLAIASGCFGSHVTVPAICVWPKPRNLSFEEAATIPIAFLTAEYGLSHLAGVKASDRVLIHAASGGVGLAAVQVARRAGARIYATASAPKWEKLHAQGVRDVVNSRSLDFAREIMDLTRGKGVDIVLNSLAGEFIPKGLEILAPGGRFLEIGKRDIWSQEQVHALRPDVAYHPYDLAQLLRENPAELNTMLGEMLREIEAGSLRPIPHSIFPIESAASAFRFMAQAKHVGKVVISTRRHSQLLRGDRTYVITGGLGAIGREIATWMVRRGARHLALVNRSAPSDAARHFLDQLGRDGAEVRAFQADVSSYPSLAEVFQRLSSDWPPIAGVLHAAGILDDAPIIKQSWDRFAKVMAPKTSGARNLHLLTREKPLDFFVLFSSVASVFGSPGQASYAAGNAFLDALAHHRRGLGLPAASINWGPWEESGMAANLSAEKRGRWAAIGVQSTPTYRALDLLSRVLGNPKSQIVAVPIAWPEFFKKTPPELVPAVLREIANGFGTGGVANGISEVIPPFLDELRRAPPRKRRAMLLAHIMSQVRKALGLASADALDPLQGLNSLGMDSLMAVELRSRLQASLGCSLPATLAFEHPNIQAIADYVAKEILGDDKFPGAAPGRTSAAAPESGEIGPDGGEARRDLDRLSEAEMARLLEEKLSSFGRER